MLIPEFWVIIIGYLPWLLALVVIFTKKDKLKKVIKYLLGGIAIFSFSTLLAIYDTIEGHPDGTAYSLIFILFVTSAPSLYYIATCEFKNTVFKLLMFMLAFLISTVICRVEWVNAYRFEYDKNVFTIEETETSTYYINSENKILILDSEKDVEVVICEGLKEPYLLKHTKYYYEEDRNVEPASRKLTNAVYEYELYVDEEMASNILILDDKIESAVE